MFPLMMECRPTTLALFKSFMSVCTYLRSLVVFFKVQNGGAELNCVPSKYFKHFK